ncbi:MAG: ORF6N domain-containing protein [Candidatus Omnitrophota bacterium]
MKELIPIEVIASKIFEIRGKKVMLDKDLAKLYGVETKRLNEQVRRNVNRFPADFMFQLTKEETVNLISQFAISSSRSQIATLKQGQNIKYLPYVFTQEGVAMLSSVLHSKTAVRVNIQIMRAFVKLRHFLSLHKGFEMKLKELEGRLEGHDADISDIFEAIRQLMHLPDENRKITGFKVK